MVRIATGVLTALVLGLALGGVAEAGPSGARTSGNETVYLELSGLG